MWRVVRTPYGGPVPTPRDSAVANQLIGLEDWGGDFLLGVEKVSHVAGVGRYFLEWEIRVREWGICYWSGDFPFGVGNCRCLIWCGAYSATPLWCGKFALWSGASLFDVGNCRSGVGS